MKKTQSLFTFNPWSQLGLLILLAGSMNAQDGLEFKSLWVFDSDHLSRSTVRPVEGWIPGRIEGNTLMGQEPEHFLFDGETTILLTDNHNEAGLPVNQLYVESWVQVNRPLTYGGLIGAVHDNGSDESGWLLGYLNDSFCFALASQGNERITYLKAGEPFESDRWYHVAASYDGRTMRLFVNGEPSVESIEQSGPIRYPDRTWYEIGAYHDSNEFFKLTGRIERIGVGDRVPSPSEVRDRYLARAARFPEPEPKPLPLDLRAGPFVTWEDPGRIRIRWESAGVVSTRLAIQNKGGHRQDFHEPASKRFHDVQVSGLEKDTEYFYTISAIDSNGQIRATRPYLFDTTFYYEPVELKPPLRAHMDADRVEWISRFVQSFIRDEGITQGYALILGAEDGLLSMELAHQTDMQVVVVESDPAKVNHIRTNLEKARVYGARVSVHQLEPGAVLPYGAYFANYITSEKTLYSGVLPEWSCDEVYRLLRPCGGLLQIGQSSFKGKATVQGSDLTAWARSAGVGNTALSEKDGLWVRAIRPALEGAGDWSHQYGAADNAACSGDELVQGDMTVSWWGEPGPRPMPDRGPRNPAPLSVNGRLFIQGDRVLFGLDSYNGTVLWTLFNPEMRRANLIRDSSNMVASSDRLYLAESGYCWGIDAQHGELSLKIPVPHQDLGNEYDWSYLAVVGDVLIGSAVKKDSAYLGDDGEWYENYSDQETSKVVSACLFGFDRHSGRPLWEYESAGIINSTITIGDGVVYLIETANPAVASHATSRIPNALLTDTRLTAIDLERGELMWDKPQDFSQCQYMIYMSYADGKLAVTGTDKDKNYHVYAFNTRLSDDGRSDVDPLLQIPGTLLWQEVHKEDKGHHSGHLQHPVIVGDVFYSDQRAFDLKTGEIIRKDLPERRGCGTMSAGANALFFRHYFHGMWDLRTDKRVQFEGIRPGCWLGLIPAGGLLLAPESSAGCSCTHSIQTTVGYIPVAAR